MAIDFTRYQVPGVYVQDISDPIITGGGLPPSLICIVGPARGYQTAVESLIVFEEEGVRLRNQGVVTVEQSGPPVVEAPVVTLTDGTLIEEGVDYLFTTEAGDFPGTSVTYVSVHEDSTALNDGDGIVIQYNYINSEYFRPRTIEAFSTAVNLYGRPLLDEEPDNPNDTHVDSPLTLGIQLAFQNDATEVLAVPLNPSDGDLRTQFEEAYQKIKADYRANIVVPVFPDDLTVTSGSVAGLTQTLAQDLRSHCVTASNDGYKRTGFMGLPVNFDEGDVNVEALAQNISSERVSLVYPNRMKMFSTPVMKTIEVSSCYLAAALGGRLASLPINTGLTRQIVAGFTGINSSLKEEMTHSFKNNLSSNGVLVLEQDRLNRLIVRHGLTTDMTSLSSREISLVRIADGVHVGMQIGVENAGLIGQPIDAEMVIKVQGTVQTNLEQLRMAEVIVDWGALTARQQSIDPSVIEVQFAYRPAIPLNYILISYRVDLNTGESEFGPMDS